MKKYIILISIVSLLALSPVVFAQEMMDDGAPNSDGHTTREEAEGKTIWEKLQAKQVACAGLTEAEFEVLGEYFMGRMAGSAHEAMNNMMVQMTGQDGEKQMHIAFGKRMSECDPDAPLPQNIMNGGMMGSWSAPSGFSNYSHNSMMNFGLATFGWLGWIFMIIFWALIIVGVVALVKWLMAQGKGDGNAQGKSALDILKERYAKGEISGDEFARMKKDLL